MSGRSGGKERSGLIAEQRLLENVRELQEQLGQASSALVGDESRDSEGIVRQVGKLHHAIDALCSIDPRLNDVASLLDGAQASLQDRVGSGGLSQQAYWMTRAWRR